jgi:hypothetical protein
MITRRGLLRRMGLLAGLAALPRLPHAQGQGSRMAATVAIDSFFDSLGNHYGAVGDGATDDSAVMSAAKAVAGTGGTILFTGGKNYLIGEQDLFVPFTLAKTGVGVAQITTKAGANALFSFQPGAAGSIIRDLKLNGPTAGAVCPLIYCILTQNITIDGITVQGGTFVGIHLDQSTGIVITDTAVSGVRKGASNAAIGAWVFRGSTATITNLTITDCETSGLVVDAGTTGTTNPAASRATGSGVSIDGCCAGGGSGALVLESAQGCNLDQITITNTLGNVPAVALTEDQGSALAGTSNDNTLTNLTIHDAAGYGIYLSGAKRNRMSGVSITNFNNAGGASGYPVLMNTGQGGTTVFPGHTSDHTCVDNTITRLAVTQASDHAYTYLALFDGSGGALVGRNAVQYTASGAPSGGLAGAAGGANAPLTGANANTVTQVPIPFGRAGSGVATGLTLGTP